MEMQLLTGQVTSSAFPMNFSAAVGDEAKAHDYQVLVPGATRGSDALVQVKGVRDEVANAVTGTPFC
jgi:hypothetical protein